MLNSLKLLFAGRPFFYLSVMTLFLSIIYSNTLNAPFQLDDFANIVDNPAIKDFDYFADASKIEQTGIPISRKLIFYTRNIGYLTFAFNFRLNGLDVTGYHIFNIMVHLINSLLIYWIASLSFRTPFADSNQGNDRLSGKTRVNYTALLVSFMFAVHPIQTQAVTYIVQRFASLAALFYLLALAFYIKFRLSGRPADNSAQSFTIRYSVKQLSLYSVSLISAVLAMKTKEFSMTLPLVICIYELMFFQGSLKKRFLCLAPYGLTLLIIPLTLFYSAEAMFGIDELSRAAYVASDSEKASGADYFFTQFRVIATYARLLYFPVNQNLDYDYPLYGSFFMPDVIISFIFVMSMILFAVLLQRLSVNSEGKSRLMLRLSSFGLFWFLITLSAESVIVPTADVIFEHRLYLPSAGFFCAVIPVGVIIKNGLNNKIIYAGKAFVSSVLFIILAMSALTYARNAAWKDEVIFWEDVVKKSPGKSRPHNLLGISYRNHGRIEDSAIEFRTAAQLNPGSADAHNNLGMYYIIKGMYYEAINEFLIVLSIQPDYPMARQILDSLLKKTNMFE